PRRGSRHNVLTGDARAPELSRHAGHVRQSPAAVGPERHRTIERIRSPVLPERATVSRSRAREWNVHRLTWLYRHVRQRLVETTRRPAPELHRGLAHSYDLRRRGRWDRASQGRGAPRSADAHLIGPLVRVSDERELRIP